MNWFTVQLYGRNKIISHFKDVSVNQWYAQVEHDSLLQPRFRYTKTSQYNNVIHMYTVKHR